MKDKRDDTIRFGVAPYALPQVILILNAREVDFSITQIDGELFVCIDEAHLTEKVYGLLSKPKQSGELCEYKGEKELNATRYRKKPVVIDAILYNGKNVYEVLCFLNDNIGKTPESIGHNSDNQIMIKTLEGTMLASVGDYIIKGVNGEFYPCKPDIFEKTYEKVGE